MYGMQNFEDQYLKTTQNSDRTNATIYVQITWKYIFFCIWWPLKYVKTASKQEAEIKMLDKSGGLYLVVSCSWYLLVLVYIRKHFTVLWYLLKCFSKILISTVIQQNL